MPFYSQEDAFWALKRKWNSSITALPFNLKYTYEKCYILQSNVYADADYPACLIHCLSLVMWAQGKGVMYFLVNQSHYALRVEITTVSPQTSDAFDWLYITLLSHSLPSPISISTGHLFIILISLNPEGKLNDTSCLQGFDSIVIWEVSFLLPFRNPSFKQSWDAV